MSCLRCMLGSWSCGCGCSRFAGGLPSVFYILFPLNNQTLTNLTHVSGIGMPGATVEIEVDNRGPQTVTVAPNGTWNLVVDYALPNGTHSVRVVHRSGRCVETRFASIRVVDAPAVPQPNVTSPAQGETLTTTMPIFMGTARPGYIVNLCVEHGACVQATADVNGNFSAQYPYNLAQGSYVLMATQRDPVSGATSSVLQRSFYIQPIIP